MLRTKGSLYPAAIAAGLLLGGTGSHAGAQLLDDAVWFEREIGEGIVWRYAQFDDLFDSKQSISYALVDLTNPAVELHLNYRDAWVGPSPGLDSPDFPRELTSAFAEEIPGSKVAINGSFFNTSSYDPNNPDEPWGGGTTYLKVDGEVIHNLGGGAGLVFNNREEVTILPENSNWPGPLPAWDNAITNHPMLLVNGVIQIEGDTVRHPRTVVGIDDWSDPDTLILLVVDGRTEEAAGMTFHELSLVMLELGATEAFNLDGGGSSTLWAAGEPFNGVVNFPSDNGSYDHLGQRRAANAIVVVSDEPGPAEWDGRLTSLDYPSLTRVGESLTVTATYENIGTETWTADDVSVVPSRPFGRTSEFIPAGEEDTFVTMDPETVPPGESVTFTLDLVPPEVETSTLMTENFALWHETEGYFGPRDNNLRVRTTVRPELTDAPPVVVVQGTGVGPNNQWYEEDGGWWWTNSSISFPVDGVADEGTQRISWASATGRWARFRPIFDVPGIYKVEVAFPSTTNSIEAVEYTVDHLDGDDTTVLNQHPNGGLTNQWIVLGEFPFSDDHTKSMGVHSVTVTNGNTTGNRFYSGAARFDYVGPLEPTGVEDWSLY